MSFTTVGELAREKGILPRVLTTLFYDGALDSARCPIVSGRRMIPRDYVPAIECELRRRGLLPRLRSVAGVTR